MRKYWFVMVFVAGLLVTACGDRTSDRPPVRTPLLLWHSWNDRETAILDELLEKFSSIYPDIMIVSKRFPPAELPRQFLTQAQSGMGPDLVLLQGRLVQELANAGHIQPLPVDEIELSEYFSTALATLRYRDKLYGLPLSLHTFALYYNKTRVAEPPETLQALLAQVDEGKRVALNTGFYGAFWGIQAFGGQVFDTEGRIVLNQGGFANWLGWLKKAQNVPAIILSNDANMLRSVFVEDRVDYYTADSMQLLELQDALGEEVVGVAPLPAGPANPSGPILETEALVFHAASAPEQTELALRLAQFLTNFEQQTILLRKLGRVPANSRVWVDPRIYPAVAGFAAQTRTSVALPNIPQVADVQQYGNDAYIQSLAGIVEPQKAAAGLTARINEKYGFDTIEELPRVVCDAKGALRVWYLPLEMNAAALETIRANFMQICPEITVQLEALELDESEIDADSQVYELYQSAISKGEGPDLLIGSNHLTALLAAEGILQEVDELVEPEFLQRYLPEVLEAMRYEGRLYGLPLSIMELMALYYNTDLVADPPLVLDDLLHQADAGKQVVLPINFYYAFWGLPVFGANVFDDEYRVILNQGGFADWMTWLRQAQEHPGVILQYTDDVNELTPLFAEGHAAYLAGEVSQLSELQAALGQERVRVVPLPAGPQGKSGPILGVQGVMLNPKAGAEQVRLAIEFAKHITEIDSQTVLMEQANQVPANVNVDAADYPAIAGFLRQAASASVPPIVPQVGNLFYWGNDAYFNVLERGLPAQDVVDGLTDLVNKTNGFPVAAPEAPPECKQEDRFVLWHSWLPVQAAALETLMTRFSDDCPGIQIKTEFVPVDEMLERFTVASQTGAGPDLLLAPHSLIDPLTEAGLIKDIAPFVEASTLVSLRFGALSAFEQQEALYGVPLACYVMGLYYNSALTDGQIGTVDDLLSSATPEVQVALDTTFYGAYWGIPAFGGQLLDEANQLALDQGGFEEWLVWLKAARTQPGMVLNQDIATLHRRFTTGKAAYLIAGSEHLPAFRAALGAEQVGVTYLPAGPDGYPGMPLLDVQGLMFNARLDGQRTRRALAFATFAASDAGQTLLMNEALLIPANQLTVVAIDDPVLGCFSEIVDYSRIVPDFRAMSQLTALGNRVYHDVLSGASKPAEAIDKMMRAMKEQ